MPPSGVHSTINWLCRGSLYGSTERRSWAVAHRRRGSNLSDRRSPAIAPGDRSFC
jgi:hypothetical protein